MINTLYLRVDGSTKCKGHPFILIRPFPRLQKATAVAVFLKKKHAPPNKLLLHINTINVIVHLELLIQKTVLNWKLMNKN